MEPPPIARVEALDLLRGLCAVGVVLYHLLSWLGIAQTYNLGLYGVYIFFLLSGASMSLAYGQRLGHGYPVVRYLARRYLRLAPLYVLVVTVGLFLRPLGHKPLSLWLAEWLLNVTFLFGFVTPGKTSLITGGWSLGIEFLFYLAFPALLALMRHRLAWAAAASLLLVQVVYVNLVLRDGPLEAHWASYTQLPAFVGYFAFGVWMGLRRLSGQLSPAASQPLVWTAWAFLLLLIATQSGATATASLVGERGVFLVLFCCLLLVVTLKLEMPERGRALAAWLGAVSYPLYLLHPVINQMIGQPRLLGGWRSTTPVLYLLVVLAASLLCATIVHRWLEEPVQRWGKRRIG